MSSLRLPMTALLAFAAVGVCAQAVVHEGNPARIVGVGAVRPNGGTYVDLATFISHMGQTPGPAEVAPASSLVSC